MRVGLERMKMLYVPSALHNGQWTMRRCSMDDVNGVSWSKEEEVGRPSLGESELPVGREGTTTQRQLCPPILYLYQGCDNMYIVVPRYLSPHQDTINTMACCCESADGPSQDDPKKQTPLPISATNTNTNTITRQHRQVNMTITGDVNVEVA